MHWVFKKSLPYESICKIKSYMYYPWDIRNNSKNRAWVSIHNKLTWIKNWDPVDEEDEINLEKEGKTVHHFMCGIPCCLDSLYDLQELDAKLTFKFISNVFPEEDREFFKRRHRPHRGGRDDGYTEWQLLSNDIAVARPHPQRW